MRIFKALALLAAIGLAAPASAAVHKCIGPDGQATWSDKPCTVYPKAGATGTEPEVAPVEVTPAPEAAQPSEPSAVRESAAPAEPAQPQLTPEEQAQVQMEQMEEQMAALEAEFTRRLEKKKGLLALSGILILVAWLWHVIAAVRMDKIVWAIFLFLFSPLSNIPFTIVHWQKAKVGFFIYVAGIALMVSTIVSLYSGLIPAQGL